jgi:hypothetical protein
VFGLTLEFSVPPVPKTLVFFTWSRVAINLGLKWAFIAVPYDAYYGPLQVAVFTFGSPTKKRQSGIVSTPPIPTDWGGAAVQRPSQRNIRALASEGYAGIKVENLSLSLARGSSFSGISIMFSHT